MPAPSAIRLRLAAAVTLLLGLPLLAQVPESAGEATALPPEDAPAIPADDPSVLDAVQARRAQQSLLLDVLHSQAGYVAVGERGHILGSSDGRSWTQRPVPTRATLTAIASTTDGQFWAAGHDGVILQSVDGGQSWQRRRVAPWSIENTDPTRGIPILDLLFAEDGHGFAIGAYSLMLVTEDGGVTWSPRQVVQHAAPAAPAGGGAEGGEDWTFSDDQLQLEAESDPHFNAITRTGSGAFLIAGERGSIFRSRDGGQSWEKVGFPYGGSMFGALSWDGEHVLVFGLRGNVYESDDLGGSWRKVEVGVSANLIGGTALPNGGAVLVGANGVLLVRKDGASAFEARTYTNAEGETPVLSGVLARDGTLLLIGEKGVDQIPLQ
jgi:photosystem II stability/assembly factor-like uncharacterized protein